MTLLNNYYILQIITVLTSLIILSCLFYTPIIRYFNNYYSFNNNRKKYFNINIFQSIYLGLILLVTILFINTTIYANIINSTSYLYKYCNLFLIYTFFPFLSYILYISSSSNPIYINESNVNSICLKYPLDNVLYTYKICSTCNLIKPARSKHCSICNHCIDVCDHHCIWLNNCIGYGNHKYFLIFLSCTISLAIYGFFIMFPYLYNLYYNHIIHLKILDNKTNLSTSPTLFQSLLLFLKLEPLISSLFLFSIFIIYILSAFNLHHCYLYLIKGITTNEYLKLKKLSRQLRRGEIDLYQSNNHQKITNTSQIINIYNKGFYHNLNDLLYPDLTFNHHDKPL